MTENGGEGETSLTAGEKKVVILLVIAIAAIGAWLYFSGDSARPMVFIDGPPFGQAGQPVEFTIRADGATDAQLFVAPDAYCVETGPGKFTFMDPDKGTYALIAVAAKGGKVGVATAQYVNGDGPSPPPTPPDPDDPPDPYPPDPWGRLSAVASEAVTANLAGKRQLALDLADAFDKAAVDGHLLEDPADFRSLVREYSNGVFGTASPDIIRVNNAVETEIQRMAEAGTIKTSNDYAKAWQAVAEGFRGAAQ